VLAHAPPALCPVSPGPGHLVSGRVVLENPHSLRGAEPIHVTAALRRQAGLHPRRRAFLFLADGEVESESLTYRALDRRARAVAALLQRHGAAGERVLLLFPPGLDFVTAFFGCLYAGMVAVPAPPPRSERSLPRLRAMVRDAAPRVVLAPAAGLDRLGRSAAGVHEWETLRWLAMDGAQREEGWLEPTLGTDALAFLQYTSGSTADPKGVMVTHGNLVANAAAIARAADLDETDVLLGWLPLYHDMGLIGIVTQSVLLGARCVLMSPTAFLQRPLRWLRAVERFGATLSGGPDFAYDLCVRRSTPEERAGLDLRRWRVAFNGAEPVRPETLDRFTEAFAPAGFRATALCPCYGLAEATLMVSMSTPGSLPAVREVDAAGLARHRVEPPRRPRRLAGSGTVAPGAEVAIVHPRSRRRLDEGRVGEVWVAGPLVAAGYWNRTRETARTFRARPVGDDGGAWLRTGDLGFLADGELFVTGRIKDLMVIRGRNVYPQDVERTAEASHPAFQPGGAAAFAVEAGGRERLAVALEVGRHFRAGDAGEAVAALRQAVLDEHEAEVYGVALLSPSTLPRTSSGKVRRRACRDGFLARTLAAVAWDVGEPSEERVDGETGIRQALARALGRLPRGADESRPLAALGLDSLAAVELQHALETGFGIALSLPELLEASPAEIAARVASTDVVGALLCGRPGLPLGCGPAHGAALPNRAATQGRPYEALEQTLPLSYGQRALWFLHRLDPGGTAYHLAFAAWLRSGVDGDRLGAALAALVGRHPILRTIYEERGGEPVARVRPAALEVFAVIDARALPDLGGEELRERLAAEAVRPFDLATGPVLRVRLLLGPAGRRALVVVAHHIAVDLWSVVVLLDELARLVAAPDVTAAAAELPPAGSWAAHVAAERARLAGPEGERLWEFWYRRLGGRELPLLALPADRPRPSVARFRGAGVPLAVGPEVMAGVKALARDAGATLFTVLLAAFQVLLGRLSGQEEVLVGSPAACRGRPELEGLVANLVNSLVLRGGPAEAATVRQLLARAWDELRGALAHQDFPFPLLVERLQPRRDSAQLPVFQALLALEWPHRLGGEALAPLVLGSAGEPLHLGPMVIEPLALDLPGAQLDLALYVIEQGGGLLGSLRYDADLFDAATAARWVGCFATLLAEMVARPDERAAELPLLSAAEVRQLLGEREPRPSEPPSAAWLPIYERFATQAARTPDAPALIGKDQEVTYRELAERAGQIAAWLARRGIGHEDCVGVLLPRTPDLVAAILGILRCGAAYLPLDPAYPRERIAWMVEDAGAAAVIDGSDFPLLAAPVPPPTSTGPGRLFAVIYTSGSTGRPKGVGIEERSVAALLAWAQSAYSEDEIAGVLAATSVCFDLSLFELFVPLTRGGAVVLADNALELPRLPARMRVTLLNTVPSAAAELVRAGALPASVRTVNLAGEPLPEPLARTLAASGRRVLNLYGPTETTVYSTWAEIGIEEREPPIGQPLPGERALVLDRRMQPVPPGVLGELYLGGAGLARGYLGRPEQTAERFLPDPWGSPGGRLYRTGDLARLLPNGELAFLGRLDHQVKIRGFRIEPGEVEAALAAYPGVAEAAVAARPEPGGGQRLVAWVVPAGDAVADLPSLLRTHLATRLPSFLVPAVLVVLSVLPRTPNGKLDRAALPDPSEASDHAPAAAPRTPLEGALSELWTELLGRPAGPDDDFFALGGHSLLAVRLAARIREVFGIDLPVPSLFRWPTLAGLAAEVARLRAGEETPSPAPRAVPRSGPVPLSFAQQRLWFLDRLEPESPRYNVPAAIHLDGPLDSAALEGALCALARRHEALRTRFAEGAGGPVQEIDPDPDLPLPRIDLASLPGDRRDAETRRLGAAEARRPFDLARGPVVRARLLRRGTAAHTLLLVFHHIAVDGWSLALLLRELAALLRGEPIPPPPLQIADFALWQRAWMQGETLAARLAAGRARLAGIPDLALATDRPRPPVLSSHGGRRPLVIPLPLAGTVDAFGRRAGATPFVVLLAAFEAVLGRWTGQEGFAVGAPVAGRDRAETAGVVGLFVNTLVLRADLTGEPSFAALVARVREDAFAAYSHQDLPFDRLVEALAPARDLSRAPLFQAMLSLMDVPLPDLDLPGLAARVEEVEAAVAKLDLTLELSPQEDGLAGAIEFSSDLFDPATAERLAGHFLTLLAGALAEPDRPLPRLSLLSELERHQLLLEWRGIDVGAPLQVLSAIAAWAAREPEAPALLADEEISRGALARRAGDLARRLAARGVGPEAVVGVRIERSAEMAVALLAVLQAGGAFLPLDPAHPPERLAGMLADAGARLLLVRAGDAPALSGWTGETLAVDVGRGAEVAGGHAGPPLWVSAEQAAYVIFTSGSTGRPKGVVVSHRALAGLCRAAAARYGLGPGDRVLAFASPAFDVMVEELFASLAAGAAVAPAPPGIATSLDGFVRFVAEKNVTVANLPASFWHAWVADLAAAPPPETLRLVVAGSERLAAEKVAAWRAGTRIPLLNAYGVTEAAVTSAVHEPREESEPVPVGRSLSHAEIVLLDRWGGPAPLGAPGEVAIGGPGLARGYLGRPDLTADRFVPHPWSAPGSRLYRTGDLGRLRADGTLELLGRLDRQVKVRGVRIEPEEIEAALEAHPEVARAAVAGYPGTAGARLAAWIVPGHGAPPDPAVLRAFLAARLPEAMVPASWIFLEALPLTPSGKVDRGALPAPAVAEPALPTAPRTAAETILAEVWSRVLGVGTVGVHDNFFALGGDSILTLQVVAGARARGLAVTPRQIFEHPSVAALARVAAPATPEPPRQDEEGSGGPFPLTPIQRWFFALDQPEPHHFNQALLLISDRPLDPAAAAGAVAALVSRHDALRLRFEHGPQGRQQRVAPEERDIFTVADLAALPAPLRPAALAAAAATAQRGFALAAGPLFRAVLFGMGADEADRLFLAAHHLAVDGVSWRVLLTDLDLACQQAAAGEAIALPASATSLRRWAVLLAEHAHSAAAAADLPRWLAAAPRGPVPLPGDLAGEPGPEGEAETVSVMLSHEATEGLLRGVSAVYGARPDEALLAALAHAAGGRLWVDVEAHGREADRFPGADLSRTVGWFTAQFPLLIELAAGGAPGAAVRIIQERLRTLPGRGLSWGLLRYGGGEAERALATLPRPRVSFNYLGRVDGSWRFAAAPESAGPQRSPAAHRTHRLEVSALVIGGRLRIDCTGDRGDRSALERLAADLTGEIDALLAHPLIADPGVEDLYPLTPAQKGILFHDRAAPRSGVYVEQLIWTFAGGLDRRALKRAWSLAAVRHAVLRTAFPMAEEPLQVVRSEAEPEWHEEDWSHRGPGEQEERLAAHIAADQRRGFDPARAPLHRLALFRLGDDRWQFLWSHHHVLLDGWSLALVLEEVLAAYEAFARGEEPALSVRPPFREFVTWLLRRDTEGERGFWQALLAGFSEPTPLGIDRIDRIAGRAGEKGYGQRRFALPAAVSQRLLALARRRGWTPATLVHAAWALLLGVYSGGEDVVFGSVTSGRTATLPGAEEIVGLLANTLPVRVELAAAEPLADWLDRLQARLVEIRQRETTPLPEIRGWSEVPRDRPLFESLVAFENYPLGEAVRRWRGGSQIEDVRALDRTHYPLTLMAALDPDLWLTVLFDRSRFEAAALDRLEGHLAALLAGMAAGEDRPLSALSLLTPAEAAQIAAWAEGSPETADALPVHLLCARQASRTPGALAVVYAGDESASLTYRELDERVNRLAHHLRALGVGAEVPVALCVERSLDAVVGLLAILKAGGFCLPLDPAYPRQRLAIMLDDARPAALVTWERLAAALPATGTARVLLDHPEDLAAIAARSPEAPAETVSLEALAYALYTSGSTGRPKGVAVSHRVLRNLIDWQISQGVAQGPRRTLQFSPWSFDVCMQEVFSTLGAGGTLVLVPEEWRADGPRLWRLIEERGIERLFLPFVALELLAESAPPGDLAPSLREIATAGEQLRVTPAVAGLFARLPGCALVNHYGPTETHVATFFPLAGPPTAWPALPPVGHAIAGGRVAILDPWLRPVPVGVAGEICIGGAIVGRGYLGRPELTAGRFVPDPTAPPTEPGSRIYLTGDLGRLRGDGEIEFLGRRDGQVKVRGVRVELGEVEAVLAAHPAVLQAAAAARRDAGGTSLLAAVVPRPETRNSELAADLHRYLRERLPSPMIPADLVVCSELPLTPSGKVDRRALAGVRPDRRTAATPPGTAIERELAAIWEELLRVQGVGLEDNFFALGGHSLLAGRLLARVLANYGIEISLPTFLDDPTLGGMATAVTAALVAGGEAELDPLLLQLEDMDEAEAERLLAAGGEVGE
jgi:amino acid adenylation domain-containing protein/non-ribosomal peptide synthase protein (TIGR01720 family)